MADNLIENLYEKSLLIKDDNGNEVELQPHPIPKFSCVQYCRRLPNNLSCSVHYEVYTSKEKDEIKGYWVALHTEGETAGGNKQIRKKLVDFLKQGLRLNGKIQISNFILGSSWTQIDLHNKEIISPTLTKEEFLKKVNDLLNELYNLVENLLKEAENNKELNPYWDDKENNQNFSTPSLPLVAPIDNTPNNNENLGTLESNISIVNVTKLLQMNLRIPNYQRPYTWTSSNVIALLEDIEEIMESGKSAYRVGTLILRKRSLEDTYEIVDGQQRILTFTLILMALNTNFTPKFTQDKEFQKLLTYNKTSQKNLHDNFQLIKEYIDSLDKNQQQKIYSTIENILELVVIVVKNQSEAFQLFDSQNTRGKKLDPHDLLKAFHLREISDIYSMRHNTEQWENTDNTKIRKLFNCYLYPIMNWINRNKTNIFTDKDIYYFKGVRSSTEYRYSKRIIRCMPCFQLGESFEAGENFFGMVNYYLRMREDIETEMMTNPTFSKIKNVLKGSDGSKGFELSKRLFFCALMTYYDRFGNFDIRAINKLCLWAFTIRLDMDSLRANTINAYAIGIGTNHKYSNNIPMFSIIKNAYSHLEIANLKINKNSNTEKRNNLRYKLEQLFA